MSDSFDGVVEGLRDGEKGAWDELDQRFKGRLIQMARKNLSDSLIRKAGATEAVQDAMFSFFKLAKAERVEAAGWNDIWRLLRRIVRRKCQRQDETTKAQKRDRHREHSLASEGGDSQPGLQLEGREQTPMEIATLRDELEWLATKVSERCLRVIILALNGFDNAEIAEKVQRSTRTVIRDKEKALEILQKRDESLKTEPC